MIISNTINELRVELNKERKQGKRIAFVPTMGNLHAGHLSLIRRAHQVADCVVASIFVNPMQFGANEDLDRYPRTLAADQEKLIAEDTHYLFAPGVAEIYPQETSHQTQVSVPDITETLCGASRPGHFTGVSTVVNKLFNIVQADVAVFGEKDYQQLAVIRKMVSDLCIPIEIIGIPTARAEDGLALSSRNGYLNQEQRKSAPRLYEVLQQCQQEIASGALDPASLSNQIHDHDMNHEMEGMEMEMETSEDEHSDHDE